MVRSSMEYACTIWDPHWKQDIKNLEMVQRQAARWVFSKYSRFDSVTELLNELKWVPLQDRRKQNKLCLFHKIHQGLVKLKFERDFQLSYVKRNTRTGSTITEEGEVTSHKLSRPITKKSPLRNGTINTTTPAWNILPVNITSMSTSEKFRSALKCLP